MENKKKIRQNSEKVNKRDKSEKYSFSGKEFVRNKKSNFIEEMRNQAGNVEYACNQLGISRRSYQIWRKKDPEFNRACEDISEGLLDFAEIKLQQHIQKGNIASVIFFLKTKGKKRGYVERFENYTKHSGEIQQNVGITYVLQDDPDYEKDKRNKLPPPMDKTIAEPLRDVSNNKKSNNSPQDSKK